MVFMPPGSAKSTYASVLFPAWWLASHPRSNVIGVSYGSDLARSFSKKVQSVVNENSETLGYGLRTENAERWSTTNGSEYLSAGAGAAITGFRSDLVVIDDPVKGRSEADSLTIRDKIWNGYLADIYTRRKPGCRIALIQCMTGDTRVLLASGREKPLRDIRPGDEVATYESGKITASTVRNWANQGPDRIFTIRMKSGISVRANGRHPFLVHDGGEEKWQRTDSLKRGSVILRAIGANGRKSFAPLTDATCRRSASECATRTTTKLGEKRAFDRHPPTLSPTAHLICATVTGLISKTTRAFLPNRGEFAPSVSARQQAKMSAPIGATNCASIIATIAAKFAGFSAMTATWRLVTGKLLKSFAPPLNTYKISHDTVAEVTECGIEDVFDIQVDRTENFIANGLVSHNTRWHEDDLAGRLQQNGGDGWRVIKLPAFATAEDDPLGRQIGEPLWGDDKYGYAADLIAARDLYEANGGGRDWQSLYQQDPRPGEGALFKTALITTLDAAPPGTTVRAWDLAATAQVGTRDPDWTVGVKLTKTGEGRFVVGDVVRLRGGPDEVEAAIAATASRDGRSVRVSLPQDPGQAGKSQVLYLTRKLAGYNVESTPETGDKATRASPVAAQCNVGNLSMVRAGWNASFVDELGGFPSATKDDQVDALSRAFGMLVAPSTMKIVKLHGF